MSHFAIVIRVAIGSNQCRLMAMEAHFVTSGHVFVVNCASVLAETIVVDPMRVVSIHSTSQETRADLPMPRPEETTLRNMS